MRILSTVAVVFMAGLLSAGCTGMNEPPITIGAMYNLTGAQKNLDIPSSEGARLAVDQANRRGGVIGHRVEMVLVDGETNPKLITEETGRLIERNPAISGLIGFSDTDMVLAAAGVAAKHRRVFLTSGATSPRLPADVPEYLFLACFGDNVQAAAGAEWAYRHLNARNVAVLFNESTSYTRLLHGYFETRFQQLGGRVLSVQSYRQGNLAPKLQSLRQADMIYLSAYPNDVTTVIPWLRKSGVTAPILGGDGLDIGDAWKKIPSTRDVYFTTHAYLGADNPDLRVQRFRKLYAEAHPGKEPDAFTALGYDAAQLLMVAVETAGTATPGPVRKALAATKGFQGVTGEISYLDGSRIPAKSVAIMQVGDGRQKYVGSVLPESVPAQ